MKARVSGDRAQVLIGDQWEDVDRIMAFFVYRHALPLVAKQRDEAAHRIGALEAFHDEILAASNAYQNEGANPALLMGRIANAISDAKINAKPPLPITAGPSTTDRPTGAGDFDIVCDGCGEPVPGY
jgi:hypothetical protein